MGSKGKLTTQIHFLCAFTSFFLVTGAMAGGPLFKSCNFEDGAVKTIKYRHMKSIWKKQIHALCQKAR